MSDESKLGLVAGVLAVIGVAVFGFPADRPPQAQAPPAATASAGPALPPAAVPVAASR